ncbi:MAG: hypothetical protein C4538_10530 [Nitrospiraceae bacterium]|nr:MAG: hypothetical protein C4538_10530 [Nitrospiraceae bacterium]
MALIKCCYKNILENSTVTLSAGTEDSNYPLYRLYDRDIGKVFKPTAAVTIEVKVNQGASGNLAADRLLIPAGHNLNGMTLDMKYSDDDSGYTPAVAQWVQAGSGLIEKNWTSGTHRYWKFIITTPASIPQIPEIFLTQTYTWERNPSRPIGSVAPRYNVERDEDAGGHARFLVHGDPRRYRSYPETRAKSAQRVNIEAFYNEWAGSKPFFLCDHEGNWIYGELLNFDISEQGSDLFPFSFEFLEILP